MEIKNWTYEEYPSFDENVEGVLRIKTTGDEKGTYIYSNVEYANIKGHPLHLQIIVPQTRNSQDKETEYPCLIYVQGSAWMEQNVGAKLGLLSRLAEKGYVIAVVEYRHSGIAAFPAQALDTRNAIRFMKIHAKEYKVNQEQCFVGGDSSGGHTAMFSQLIQDDDQETNLYPGTDAAVKGILSFYGALSVMLEDGMPSTLDHHLPQSPEGREMGGINLREHPEFCKKLSVECYIEKNTVLPPVLMFHGTKDRTINPRISVLVYKRLKSCKKEAELYLLEGADHGGSEFWSEEIQQIVIQFFDKTLKKGEF